MKCFLFVSIICILLLGCGSPGDVTPTKSKLQEAKGSMKILDSEVIEEMSWLIRSGFYEKQDLLRIFCEEMYAPGKLDTALVSATIDTQMAKMEEEKKSWPAVTDCDRLDMAFAAMEKRGLIAIQNAGNTQTDGFEIFQVYLEEHPQPETVIGYCFYHNQDLERVVAGDDLFLAFGPIDPKEEKTKGIEVGRIVLEELESEGLKVEWDRTFNERLKVVGLVWRKR